MGTVYNVLEAAREESCAVFTPSSIAAFGPTTPRDPTPQDTVQRPTTIYGVSKVAGELLCDYYHERFGLDTRGLRYPGLISHVTAPGGGTTDYAVDIFYHAIEDGAYTFESDDDDYFADVPETADPEQFARLLYESLKLGMPAYELDLGAEG